MRRLPHRSPRSARAHLAPVAPLISRRVRWGSRAAAVVLATAAAACAQGGTAPMPTGADAGDQTLLTGRAVWIARCERCHGPAGKGGAGPRLAGRVTTVYPDPAAELAVIANGKGSGMPAWKSILSAEELDAVLQYTRRVL